MASNELNIYVSVNGEGILHKIFLSNLGLIIEQIHKMR